MLFAHRVPLLGFLVLAMIFAVGPISAAELISGDFLALKDCPAWVSKAQQTNPDDFRLVPGRLYPTIEKNLADAPDAYRLAIPGANPRERWVAADCGEYPPKSNPAEVAARFAAAGQPVGGACANPPPSKDPCRACGKAVYWVLDLAWLPGRCEVLKGKPEQPAECLGLDDSAYGGRNLTLGEMRPALNRCRKAAGYCGAVDKEVTPHTDYPELTLSEVNQKGLLQVLPGILANTGQERHEWFKNGSCSGMAEDPYFKLLIDLTRQFNQSGMGEFLAQNRGNKIRREDFFQAVERSFGKDSRKHINIECTADGKLLTGVLVYLPQKPLPGLQLAEMLKKSPSAGARGNCASKFVISGLPAP